MPQETTYYQLKKPLETETYNIDVFNDNFDEIDKQININAEAINTKQPLITGSATTITSATLTKDRVVITNSNGKIAVSDITTTKLGYLSDVTSNIQAQINSVSQSVTDEATARANAEVSLQGKINAEATARANAISSEASARSDADSTLQGKIDAESTARASADSSLQSKIDAEATARSNADSTLQTNIDNGLATKVSKSGDTISGNLTVVNSPAIFVGKSASVGLTDRVTDQNVAQYIMQDKNGAYIGGVSNAWFNDGMHRIMMETVGETGAYSQLGLYAEASGVNYATAPSTPSNATSNEIATANWCIGKFVDVSGGKFTGLVQIDKNALWINSSNPMSLQSTWTWMGGIEFHDNNATRIGDMRIVRSNVGSGYGTGIELMAVGANNVEARLTSVVLDDGTTYATAPASPPAQRSLRNITISTSAPSGGNNGDLWGVYS